MHKLHMFDRVRLPPSGARRGRQAYRSVSLCLVRRTVRTRKLELLRLRSGFGRDRCIHDRVLIALDSLSSGPDDVRTTRNADSTVLTFARDACSKCCCGFSVSAQPACQRADVGLGFSVVGWDELRK